MSRAFKFRAWYQGKMYAVQRIEVVQTFADYTETMDVVTLVDVATGASKVVAAHQAKIMQFTGLLDKNGKEIFEGDTCYLKDSYHETYEVYWNDDRWGLRHDHEDYDNGDYYRGNDINNWHKWEVIGNLYENPELLKEQA